MNKYQYLGFNTIVSVLTEIKLYCPNPDGVGVWGFFFASGVFSHLLFKKGTFWIPLQNACSDCGCACVYTHLHVIMEFKITKYLSSKNAQERRGFFGPD